MHVSLRDRLTALRSPGAIRLRSGNPKPAIAARDIMLLCRVENGEMYIPEFLDHYRSLGVRHLMFVDTGSTDRTRALLSHHDDVTLWSTALPFKTHRLWMRRWLMQQVPAGTWTLNVDVDEFFDYPYSHTCDLSSLIDYLSHHDYAAMRAHQLDCFADAPLTAAAEHAGTLRERYPWYDLSAIERIDDPAFGNGLPALRGGVRTAAFGSEHFWLTKHPLIRADRGVKAFVQDEHTVPDANVADVTGVLLHYKFTAGFRAAVDDAIRRKQHWNDSAEYHLYQDALQKNPHLSLKRETARRFTTPDALLAEGFLTASDRFRAWADGSDRG